MKEPTSDLMVSLFRILIAQVKLQELDLIRYNQLVVYVSVAVQYVLQKEND